ncbi:hypothetical protein GOODEAATRI_030357 [Goodea atripinnis]|uniref:Uncharacterized protein n=1 Tax=Goodea atripinnis TaxID=208336 RepID=A0ABV0P0W0_9TELE
MKVEPGVSGEAEGTRPPFGDVPTAPLIELHLGSRSSQKTVDHNEEACEGVFPCALTSESMPEPCLCSSSGKADWIGTATAASGKSGTLITPGAVTYT